MIPDRHPTFSTSNTPLPPVETNGKRTVVNYSLTIEEVLYAYWQQPHIQSALEQKANFVFLTTSQEMQASFTAYSAGLQDRTFTQDALKIETLSKSIQEKTAAYVLNTLKISGKEKELEQEKELMEHAKVLANRHVEGRSGCMFTERQARHILTFLNHLNAQAKK